MAGMKIFIILWISGNIESTKKVDHILEMPKPCIFYDYCNSKIRLTNTCPTSFPKLKTTFKSS